MRHRHHRQVDAHHVSHTAAPQAGGVHHVLGHAGALFGDHGPAFGVRLQFDDPVTQNHVGAAVACRDGERVRAAVRIEPAFVGLPDTAHHTFQVDDRHHLCTLVRGEQPRLDAQRCGQRVAGLEELPPLLGAREADAAAHLQPDVLSTLGLDVAVQPDGVVLQRGDVGVVVHRVESGRRMPRGASGEFAAFDERDVGPPSAGEVVEHAHTDDATADDDDSVLVLHVVLSLLRGWSVNVVRVR